MPGEGSIDDVFAAAVANCVAAAASAGAAARLGHKPPAAPAGGPPEAGAAAPHAVPAGFVPERCAAAGAAQPEAPAIRNALPTATGRRNHYGYVETRVCHFCQVRGHLQQGCPNAKKQEKDGEDDEEALHALRLTADPLPVLHDGAVRWQGAARGQELLGPAGRQTGETAANAAAAATIDIMASAAAVGASSAAASTAADTAATAAAQQQPPKEAETGTMCIMAWGTGSQEMLHPCVDCGQITGRYCDYCLAEDRVEDQEWAPGQQTPLCSSCDRTFGSCHF